MLNQQLQELARSKGVSIYSQPHRIFGLDLLRASAALMVVFYHGSDLLPNLHPFLQSILSYFGFLGVELFFVLSGFLIGGILIRDFTSQLDFFQVKRFWVRRWFRTLPNYYLFYLINIILIGILAAPPDWQHLVFLQNFAWRMPDTDFFGESWSLSIEEWFYIFLPITVFLVMKLKRRRLSDAILVTIILIAGFSLVGRLILAELGFVSWRKTFRKIVILRFDSLMIGVLGSYLKFYWKNFWIKRQGIRGILVGLTLHAVVSILYFNLDLDHSLVAKTLLFSLVSFSTLLILPQLEVIRQSRSFLNRTVTNISAYSYSLYLCNIPVSKCFSYYLKSHIGLNSDVRLQIGVFFCYLVVCLGVSALIFKYFERPILQIRDRWAA